MMEQDVGKYERKTNMDEKLVSILNEMADYLNIAQMKKLQEVLLKICLMKHRKKKKYQIMNI